MDGREFCARAAAKNEARGRTGSCRLLPLAEHDRARTLWEEIFPEDTPAFLDYYDTAVADSNRIYVDEEAGEIVSMMHLNPRHLAVGVREADCSYIVAVATREPFRHQGRMCRLMKMALEDCRSRGEPFVYLMPASEKIYAPLGFCTIGDQSMLTLGSVSAVSGGRRKPAEDEQQYRCIPAAPGQIPQIAGFCEQVLSSWCRVYVKRDAEYITRIFKEQKAVMGGMLLLYRSGRLAGCCQTDAETSVEVRELFLEPAAGPADYALALEAVARCFQEKLPIKVSGFLPGIQIAGISPREMAWRPVTMARITSLEAMARLLRAEERVEGILELQDDFLSENTGSYHIEIAPEYADIRRLCPGELSEAYGMYQSRWRYTIEEFTEIVFGVRSGEPAGLRPLAPVYLQELV